MIPAWGPPSSLSPETATRSAPALSESAARGSAGRASASEVINNPEPRSWSNGIPSSFARSASEASVVSSVNPVILKLDR